jgi:hypothetical protein
MVTAQLLLGSCRYLNAAMQSPVKLEGLPTSAAVLGTQWVSLVPQAPERARLPVRSSRIYVNKILKLRFSQLTRLRHLLVAQF